MLRGGNPMHTSNVRSAAVVAAAVATGLVLWGLMRLIGIDLDLKESAASDEVSVVNVLVATLVAGMAAWAVFAFLVRRRRVRLWPVIGSTALAISMIGPSYLADGESSMALMVMHLIVGIVLIGGFAAFVADQTDCVVKGVRHDAADARRLSPGQREARY
jgi:hypothetical protein